MFPTLVCCVHFHPVHREMFQESAKCSTSERKFDEMCIYHHMSSDLRCDVYQNPQRILLSGCSYSYMRMPLLLMQFNPYPLKKKNAYEKVQVQFWGSVHLLTAPYFCPFSQCPGCTKVHAMGNATNHLTFTNHSHLGTHQLLS